MTLPVDLYDLTTHFLTEAGYKVEHVTESKYRFARVSGKNIKAGFCEHNGESYRYIDGRVAADHKNAFNKWSHCPLVVELPSTPEEGELLIGYLEFLATKEAKEWSCTFGYMDNPLLPNMDDTSYKPVPSVSDIAEPINSEKPV